MSLNRDGRIARPLTAVLFVLLLLTTGTPPALGQDEKADTKAALSEQRRKLDEAVRLNAQVVQLYKAGKAREAVAPAKQVLAIRKEVLGERHPDYADSLNNLAFLLQTQGDYAAAKPLYEQALAIRKAVLGEHHPDYATSLNNLAFLLQAQGDYAAAKPLYEQALAIRKAVLGKHHPDYAKPEQPGVLLQSQGDYAAAKPLFEQALAINKAVLGEHHPDYATSLNNLAFLLDRRGTTPPPSPSTSRRWRSIRRFWASTTPTTPPA